MGCPICSHPTTRVVSFSYPKAFECGKCGHIFLKSSQALVDE